MTERISRREFLKLAGVGTGGALLAACGLIPSEPLPTQPSLPSEIPLSTSTPTAETSPTPEATATPEAPVYEPGTVVLNPEYNLDGRVEIIPENTQAFFDYFLDTIYRINEPVLSQLTTQDGTQVTNAASLKTYLEENDWTLPAGMRIVVTISQAFAASLSEPLPLPINLRNIPIEFIPVDEYERIILDYHAEEPYIRSYYLHQPIAGTPTTIDVLEVGIVPHTEGNVYTLSLQIANMKEYNHSGFPSGDEPLTDEQIQLFNNYTRFILYLYRSMDVSPRSQIVARTEQYDGSRYRPSNRATGLSTSIGDITIFFNDMVRGEYTDTPPLILHRLGN